ncbi:hypothetical protein [Roseomonas sp. CECT 9278]|uniref:hypothetical protein n=1 Tax=Roseomonas sp. CECT 9278 TaxID=2845823 RepID=UPI001E5D9353|nr:hypothetical protein [Roseomonas sp. CECT 9278]CAH0186770.1 hypothetical protein ROS9278_01582 [Roseomonas sp. CECT 9278]
MLLRVMRFLKDYAGVISLLSVPISLGAIWLANEATAYLRPTLEIETRRGIATSITPINTPTAGAEQPDSARSSANVDCSPGFVVLTGQCYFENANGPFTPVGTPASHVSPEALATRINLPYVREVRTTDRNGISRFSCFIAAEFHDVDIRARAEAVCINRRHVRPEFGRGQ